jgi:hypothetical protein
MFFVPVVQWIACLVIGLVLFITRRLGQRNDYP